MSGQGKKPGASDADLIRYLDDELDAAGRARVEAAVARDARLADRLVTLRRRGGRLSLLLESTDPPLPPSATTQVAGVRSIDSARARRAPPIGPWLIRIAAAIVVLAGVVSLVPPLRAWIVEGLARLAPPATQDAPAPPVRLGAPDTVDVTFEVAFPTFDLELFAAQSTGRIRVRVADLPEAEARILTHTGAESFFVFPGGLRVVNEAGSAADYEVTIPASVRLVRIHVAGRRIAEYGTMEEGARDRVFELGGS